jgi:long-chain acyl-CoA synthetase
MSETQGAMPRQSVLEYFRRDSRPPSEIAVVFRRGYRTVRWPYARLFQAAVVFSARLKSLGVAKGDRVLLWGENSGEWIAAFLGCLFCGAVVVPMDAIADRAFALRVARQSGARLAVVGRNLLALEMPAATLVLEDLEGAPGPAEDFSPPVLERNDPVEIVFTSGTTAEPRGVVLTHGNLLANLEPIEKEIERYRRYERIFHPLRFLDLLPLSHVFGQLLGIFLPQIFGATSVFLDTLNPTEILRAIHDERVSVLVTVPRLVESLRDQIERDLASAGRLDRFRRNFDAAESDHFLKRWWRFRSIHRRLGWKFWAIISGGATLPAEAETFWSRLGYAVIQGYGLTETTSLVSLNHPFRLGRRSIGKALPGLEVKLAADGEILVRGENVARGYWKDSHASPVLDEDGWFHTGDIAERDQAGNYYFKGRLKNVIVTPEGLNIYPEDLETELRKEPGVRDCVVVGLDRNGNAEPCAVLLLRDLSSHAASGAAEIIRGANQRLASFQQMRQWMIWPGKDFPRTPTQKAVLPQIKQAAEAELGGESRSATAPGSSPIDQLLERIGGGVAIAEDGSQKLQLSSIERVELLSALEDRYQVDLSETEFTNAGTVAELEQMLQQPATRSPVYHYPRWAQSWPIRIFRALALNLLARPAMLLLGWPRVCGRENLSNVDGPVLVVANHVAFFDPAYIWQALPGRIRRKLAVAMDGELLESMRNPPPGTGFFKGLTDRASYWLVVSIYNVFPLPLRAGFRKSFAFAGELVDRGWSVLVFPEGVLTRDGKLSPFRAGIGLLATRLNVPVVPLRLDGIFERKAAGKKWARPGQIKVTVGPPVRFRDSDIPEQIAQDLERRVAKLGD